jgi:hypothetical protein
VNQQPFPLWRRYWRIWGKQKRRVGALPAKLLESGGKFSVPVEEGFRTPPRQPRRSAAAPSSGPAASLADSPADLCQLRRLAAGNAWPLWLPKPEDVPAEQHCALLTLCTFDFVTKIYEGQHAGDLADLGDYKLLARSKMPEVFLILAALKFGTARSGLIVFVDLRFLLPDPASFSKLRKSSKSSKCAKLQPILIKARNCGA